MARLNTRELNRLRRVAAYDLLRLMTDHMKLDKDFRPRGALGTRRVHVSAAGNDWELLIDGERFFDTHACKGGGGAIDLVMHLWNVPFKQAVTLLQEAGA